jgi:hypothetical protein
MDEERIQNLEKEIQAIKERNVRVEADKAWETSNFRIFSITAIIYIIACLLLFFIGAKNFFVSAFLPAIGYFLSVQSLPFIKRWWARSFSNRKNKT